MRRPLVPLPNRPNPTDPGDAADLSIPQGYQNDRRWIARICPLPTHNAGKWPIALCKTSATPPKFQQDLPRKPGENCVNLKH